MAKVGRLSTSFLGSTRRGSTLLAAAAASVGFLVAAPLGAPAGASAPSGSPVLIGGMAPLNSPLYTIPNSLPMLTAAVDSINAAGGIKGHPLKLDFCDTKFQAATELSCSRQLIADHVVAVVDPTVVADQSGAEYKLFATAKIPYFAGLGTSPIETTGSDSYPESGAGAAWAYGAVKALQLAGATKVALMPDVGSIGQEVVSELGPPIKALGLKNAGIVYVDSNADPTQASAAAKIVASGANGVLVGSIHTSTSLQALSQAGYKGKIATLSSLATHGTLVAAGSYGNGELVSSISAIVSGNTNPQVQQAEAAMAQYAPGATIDSTGIAFFAGVELFAKIMDTSHASTLNTAAFVTAMKNLSTPINIGLVGPWAIKGRTPGLKSQPRVLNPDIAIGIVKNGVIVPWKSGFINPFPSK